MHLSIIILVPVCDLLNDWMLCFFRDVILIIKTVMVARYTP